MGIFKNELDRSLAIGLTLIFTFNVLSSLQGVYLSSFLKRANIIATISITFFLTGIFFIFVSLLSGSHQKKISKKSCHCLLLMNFTTIGSWFGFFFSMKYIEPAIGSAFANGVTPISTLLIGACFFGKKQIKAHEWLSSVGVIISIILMIAITFFGKSGVGPLPTRTVVTGVLMALLCGFSISCSTLLSKRLNSDGVEPHQIMAFRFILLALLAGFLAGPNVLEETFSNFTVELLLLSFLGTIIPLYIVQIGIKMVDPLIVSFSFNLKPLFFIAVQVIISRSLFSLWSMTAICMSISFVLFGIYFKHKSIFQHYNLPVKMCN